MQKKRRPRKPSIPEGKTPQQVKKGLTEAWKRIKSGQKG